MKKLWAISGKIVFWASLPAAWLYLRWTTRSRVVITSGSSILVVKGWHSTGKWTLPGGGIKRGEAPNVGAVREVQEETGIKISTNQLKEFASAMTTGAGFRYKYIAYHVELESKQTPTFKMGEIIDCQWLPMSSLNLSNTKANALQLVAVWKAKRASAKL